MSILSEQENRTKTMPVMVEGFYKSFRQFSNYDNVMLVAGGTGITTAFSQVTSLLFQDRSRTIKLIWAVRSPAPLNWFSKEILYLRSWPKSIELQIYISQALFENDCGAKPCSPLDIEAGVQGVVGSQALDYGCGSNYQLAFITGGRPELQKEIANFIKHASGSIAICSCGPPTFIDRARYTFVHNMYKSDYHIDYFEEPYSC
ncbi:Fre2p [Sugiyamaella lignohabitans]|uniref:Fre2p n=1 Tax=Sugiyamaella lignohabitans TaxID=796027 RepID=A0A167EUG0_9ASCO|nr:Fre2p [Sugiyamaella lignohabitans]ANB14472.1 Fre2p [Sugiyamaella lignohabitans]